MCEDKEEKLELRGPKYASASRPINDSRSLDRGDSESVAKKAPRSLSPNRTTVEAIEEARRGELIELGSPADAIDELNRED